MRARRSWKGARIYWEWLSQAIDGQLATPTGSPVGTIRRLKVFRSVRTFIVVKDRSVFGRAQFDMGDSGLEGSANVVKAASVNWRMLTHDAERWFRELDGIIDGVHE